MIALAEMLAEPARAAGIAVPSDTVNYDPLSYPYWAVYCEAQLGQITDPDTIYRNARIVAAIPSQAIKRIRLRGLVKRGFKIG